MPENDRRFSADQFFTHRLSGSLYVEPHQELTSEGLKPIDLSVGITADPPPQLDEIIKNLGQSGAFLESLKGYESVSINPTIQNIRTRFSLTENPYVVVSGGGSHEIIERLVNLLHHPDKMRRIWGISPHFPEPTNFVRRLSSENTVSPRLIYGPINIPVESSAQESLEIAKDRVKRLGFKNTTYYLCNPTTPKGDIAPLPAVKDFVEFCADNGDLVIVDEAFRPRDEYSVIPETENLPNLIVLDSFSKRVGVPGLRGGFSVMSKEIGPYYEEMRRVYDISGPQALLLNEISNPDILTPHLENTLVKQVELKRYLMEKLDESKIRYLKTHEEVPILTIDGGGQHFVNNLTRLSVKTAKGWGFYSTEPHVSRREPMGNRYARISTPRDKRTINDVVYRIQAAKISQPM